MSYEASLGVRTDPNRLWYRVFGKYGRGTLANVNHQVKVSDSPLWKALNGCWHDLKSIAAWSLGNGTSINIWKDKWINESLRLIDYATVIPPHALDWCVTDVVNDRGAWDLDLLRIYLPEGKVTRILARPPLPSPRWP